MSWTDYTESLKAYGCSKAVLLGLDGTVWAATPDGCMGAEECTALAGLLGHDEDTLKNTAFQSGLKVGGEKFVAVNGTGDMDGNLAFLGKKGSASCAGVKSTQCIVFGVCDDKSPPETLSAVQTHVAQLAGAGY
mmetsp:Transcript_114804/g.161238  ORF Transcript_114804/g.161238 Transcript_114804/m.161238 type:complete len:134 (-) Transcript_114804:392-793(-)